MTRILGHETAMKHLLAMDATKAQSLLLEGRAGIGKKLIAKRLAAKILGSDDLTDAHPDYFLLEKSVDRKTGKEKAEINVEDARKLAKFLSLTPAQSDFRVAIIDSADRLNNAASNSILKIVEEPPRNSVIILLAHEGRVLPTIRSRCQRSYFRALNEHDMQQVLQQSLPDLAADELQILIEFAEGSPGFAHEIYENKGLDIIKELFDILANPKKANYDKLSRFADKAKKTEKEWRVYKLVISWIMNRLAKASLKGGNLRVGSVEIAAKDALQLANLNDVLLKKIAECEVFNMDKKQLIVNSISDLLRVASI